MGKSEVGSRKSEVGSPVLRPPSSVPSSTACILAWQTLRLAHERVAQRLGAELSRECGLTINEFDVLLYLHTHAGQEVRIGALLEAAPLSQPALSRLVARLEERGLLVRFGALHDGRAIDVTLTDAGEALIARAIAVHARAVHESLTGKFSEEEQAELLRTLSRIGR
jgi:DNA-binding MarR family transcriptional regulator